jgi:hypothetical protein
MIAPPEIYQVDFFGNGYYPRVFLKHSFINSL